MITSRRSGWYNESVRHSMAARGLHSRGYFAKGNKLPTYYKSGFAQGLSREEIDADLRAKGREDLIVERTREPTFYEKIQEIPVVEQPSQTIASPESAPAYLRDAPEPIVRELVEPTIKRESPVLPDMAGEDLVLKPAYPMDMSDLEDEEEKVLRRVRAPEPRTPGVPAIPESIQEESADVRP